MSMAHNNKQNTENCHRKVITNVTHKEHVGNIFRKHFIFILATSMQNKQSKMFGVNFVKLIKIIRST